MLVDRIVAGFFLRGFFFFFTPFTFKLYLKQIQKTTEDRGRVNLYKVTILVNGMIKKWAHGSLSVLCPEGTSFLSPESGSPSQLLC